MNYFTNCQNIDEVKAEWRRLCKIHHPDLPGGDLETMKRINIAYEQALLGRYTSFKKTAQEAREATDIDMDVMKKAMEIITLEGVIVEIVGRWIWATGNTRAHAGDLKAKGFFWHVKKTAWSWHDREKEGKWRSSGQTLEEIKAKYGCYAVTGDEETGKKMAGVLS